MSDVSLQFEDVENEIVETKSHEKFPVALKIIFVVLFLCILIEIVFYKFVMPSTRSPIMKISGDETYSSREIADMLLPLGVKNWFEFDVKKAVSIIATLPSVETVFVRKVFPNKVYIDIQARHPVALTFLNIGDASVTVQIDKTGFIFPENKKNKVSRPDLPIISGLPLEHFAEGMMIPQKYRPLIEKIAQIEQLPQKYFAAISEICVIPKDSGNYELALIPIKSKIRVLTDRTLDEDSLKYMMVVLDVVKSLDKNTTEIDLRYGAVSYRSSGQ